MRVKDKYSTKDEQGKIKITNEAYAIIEYLEQLKEEIGRWASH